MASGNQVRITLTAEDQASKVFQNLQGNITGAILKAGVFSSVFSGAIDAIGSGIGALTSKFNEAATIETGMISTTGTIMKLMGSSYKEAGNFVDAFNDKMSIVAAALPGATGDYVALGNGIMDNLIPAFKGLDGVLDKGAYNKTLESLTKNAGFLAVTSGTDIKLATQSLSKLLAGSSFDSLKNLKFFEANPAVLGFVESEANKLGKKFQDMTARERAEVIDRALTIPDEVIKASTQSIQGLTASFQSALFDPQTGVFGLMKDLSDKAGKQTAYQSISKSFNLLFGENGTFSQLGKILNRLTGLDVDSPMKGLQSGFDWLNNKLVYVNEILRTIQQGWGLDSVINDLQYMFNQVFKNINGNDLGKQMAGVFNSVIPLIVGFAPMIIDGLVSGVSFLIDATVGFITNLDYGKMFVGLGDVLYNLNWGNIGRLGLQILGGAILGGLAIGAGILIGLPGLLIGAIAATVIGLAAVITAKWSEISIFLGNSFSALGSFIAENWQIILLAVAPPLGLLALGFTQLYELISSNWTSITGVANSVFSSISSFFGALQAQVDNAKSAVSGLGNYLTIDGKTNLSGQPVQNKATGFMPNGLLSAAIKESKSMPVGSSLIVANSSEAVLNRSQQGTLARSISGNSGNSFVNSGAINIYDSSGNVDAIAEQIMDKLNERWQQAKQNYSAPNYT
jgi:hypothetical protein